MQIEKTYDLPYRAGDVFAVWTSCKSVVAPATRLDLNPVVGGHYKLYIDGPGEPASAEGIFFAVEKDRRIRYTWEWNRDGEISEVEVIFNERESGSRLRILHSGFQSDESRDRHDDGWDNYVAGLENILASEPGVQAVDITEAIA